MNIQQATPSTQVSADTCYSKGEAASTDEYFNERLLIAQAKAGHSNAFGELCERHGPKVFRTAFRVLRNKEERKMQRNDPFNALS